MRYLIIIVLIISALVIASDEFELINLTSKSKDFEKTLSEQLNARVVIDGEVILKILPTPHLEIMNLKVFDEDHLIFNTNKIIFDIGIGELLNDISKFSRISARMEEAYLRSNHYVKYFNSKEGGPDITINIAKAEVEIPKYDLLQRTFEVTNLVFSNRQEIGIMSGEVDFHLQKIKYYFQISDKQDISLNIDSDGFAFNISLNEFNRQDLTLKGGKVDFKIKKLDSLLQLMFDNYTPKENNLEVDRAVQYTLDASGDLVLDLNNEIVLENVQINSNFIDGLEVDLRLYKVMDNLLESYIYLSADKVDLSYIKDVIVGDLDVNHLFKQILSTSNLAEYINLNFNLKLETLALNNGEINNFFLSTYHILNRVIIDRIDMQLPGESIVSFNGLISGNAIRRQVNGLLQFQSDDNKTFLDWYIKDYIDDIREKSKLSFNAQIFGMQNLFKASRYALIRDEEQVLGNASFYEIPYEAPVKMIVIDGRNIDLDRLGIRSEWDLYLKKLYNADSDKSGEEYFRLTNANHWLRSIDKHVYFSLKLQNAIFRNEKIPEITSMLEIMPGELDIKNLTIKSDKIDGNLELQFILPVLRPHINSKMNFKTLDLKYAKALLLPRFDDIKNTADKINFLSANSYDAALNLKVDNLIIDEKINPIFVDAEANLRFGYLTISSLKYSLWNGQFDINAAIHLSNTKPTFDCNFSIYNIDPQELFYRAAGLNKITGYMSLAGNIEGNLIQLDDLQRISGGIDFLGAQITWNGFNLDKIIEIVDGQYTADSKIQNIEYYINNGSTAFDTLKGRMVINRGLINIDNANMTNQRLAGVFSMNFDLPSKNIESASSFLFIPYGFTRSLAMNFTTSGNIQTPTANTVDYQAVSDFIKPTSKK